MFYLIININTKLEITYIVTSKMKTDMFNDYVIYIRSPQVPITEYVD